VSDGPARALGRRLVPAGARRRSLEALIDHTPRLFGLDYLGRFYGTDKADPTHRHLGRTYCDVYEDYLRAWRRRSFTLLEIGVYNGASLRMWRAYFSRATVCGLDVDPRARDRAREFEIVVADQSDTVALGAFVAAHPDLRLVVDDGSHFNALTIASFEYLFPRLAPGSIYIVEDLRSSYSSDWHGYPEHNEGIPWPTVVVVGRA
jgi:hypothetical protein